MTTLCSSAYTQNVQLPCATHNTTVLLSRISMIIRLGMSHEFCLGKVSSQFLTLRVTITDTLRTLITIFLRNNRGTDSRL